MKGSYCFLYVKLFISVLVCLLFSVFSFFLFLTV